MDLYKALLTRRTVHDFTDAPVDDALITRAIEAAIQAPNHKRTEPWRYTLAGPTCRALMADLQCQARAQKLGVETLDAAEDARMRARVLNPGVALILRCVRHNDPRIDRENYASVAIAAQHIMLIAHEAGLGTKWSTGGMTRDARLATHAGIDTQAESLVGVLYIGHPARSPADMPRKLGVEDVLTRVP